MIIVLKADVKTEAPDVRRLVEFAESYPGVRTELHQIQGATRTLSELYLLGSTGVIPTEPSLPSRMPSAPAAAAVRMIAPRLRGS